MAIAFDSAENIKVNTLTWSHTCTGDNRILFVGTFCDDVTNSVTGITFNGVALTRIVQYRNDGYTAELWYLVAPATTAHDIVITYDTTPTTTFCFASSYTGVKQTGTIIDSYATGARASSSSSAFNLATTVVASDCWLVGIAFSSGDANLYGNSPTVNRSAPSGSCIVDSNATVGTGSQSVSYLDGTFLIRCAITASFAPYPTTVDYTMAAAVGAFTLTGIAAALSKGYGIIAGVGSFVLTGVAANITSARKMAASAGSFALTGIDVALKRGFTLVANAGSFVLTGVDVIFRKGLTLVASAGTFTLTGIDAILTKGYHLIAGTGVFTLTGKIVRLLSWQNIQKSVATAWSAISKSSDAGWTPQNKPSDSDWDFEEKN